MAKKHKLKKHSLKTGTNQNTFQIFLYALKCAVAGYIAFLLFTSVFAVLYLKCDIPAAVVHIGAYSIYALSALLSCVLSCRQSVFSSFKICILTGFLFLLFIYATLLPVCGGKLQILSLLLLPIAFLLAVLARYIAVKLKL